MTDAHHPGPDSGPDHDPDDVDRLIDEVLSSSDCDPEDGEGLAAALHRVRALADEPVPPETRTRHLARIRTEPPVHVADEHPVRRERRASGWLGGLQRRLAPIAAVAVGLLLFSGGGTVALAQDAGPDDALYGVKLASEKAWVAVPRGSERAAEVHLALAERRMEEVRRAPHHAEELIAAGVSSIQAAAEEKPEEAIETFNRLLGTGEEALPENASPRARWALARNCHRIADKHFSAQGGGQDLCPPLEDFEHEHPGRGAGPADGPRGWGPEGRPDDHVGPPPGVPAHERGTPGEDDEG